MVVSYATAALQTRRALELAVKWVYAYDSDLRIPFQDNLSALIHDYSFKSTVDAKIFPMLQFVISLGNKAAHTNKPIRRAETIEALKGLYSFVSWIDYSYSSQVHSGQFKPELIPDGEAIEARSSKLQQELETLRAALEAKDKALEDLLQSQATREEFRQKREAPKAETFKPEDISEFKTRKVYIDLMLEMAGWTLGSNCLEEVEVAGMPSQSGVGFVDYVLYDPSGKPVAVIEAKRTSVDPKDGKIQAKCYADCLEQKWGIRPFIFYTNGFSTHFWDDAHGRPDRGVAGFFSPAELEWMRQKEATKKPLQSVQVDESISGRHYQKAAIRAVCERMNKGHRKALLVMATGTGKTRTAISLVDVLMRAGWIKNVLFLADRRELVKQAKKNFVAQMPNLSICNLLDSKDNPESRMVFSTYPTMMNAIDQTKSKDGNLLFTPGHFDLIIVDEAHRSIYRKYQDIFTYFDGYLVGLTATPKAEVDIDTYRLFDLQTNVPTYAYELKEAVDEGFLVPYQSYESKLKFLEEGVHYDDLSDAEKEHWEKVIDDDEITDFDSNDLNDYLFNSHTIDLVLQDLMTQGIKVHGGDQIGKTIIFAKNKKHADAILKRYNSLYPTGPGALCIYNGIKYVDSAIDNFGVKDKDPQIAISVDMLDTGVDVPEVVNLVFFKKIRSQVKFWQMIGRGTRLCPDLFGIGEDKQGFRIFDYCGNFEFFRADKKANEGKIGRSLTEHLFMVKLLIAQKLQHADHQSEEKVALRIKLNDSLYAEVSEIDESHFASRLRIEFVHRYKDLASWANITDQMVYELNEHITRLLVPSPEDELAKRFDLLMYNIMLGELQGVFSPNQRKKLVQTGEALAQKGHLDRVQMQISVISRIQQPVYWQEADVIEHESVRTALRDLLDLVERQGKATFYTNFIDTVLESGIFPTTFPGSDYRSYRAKVASYLREHQNDLVIHKLRNNAPLTESDYQYLEQILWGQIGSVEDYRKEYGDEPLLKMVARMVGMDQQAAMDVFNDFLSDHTLSSNQIHFVRLIVDHVVQNGSMNKAVLNDPPFNQYGNLIELFGDKIDIVHKIVSRIDGINARLAVG